MNNNEELKKLYISITGKNIANEKAAKAAVNEIEFRKKSMAIANAEKDYPTVIANFKKEIQNGKSKMDICNNWACYNTYHGDIHWNNHMFNLLQSDGFDVKLIHHDGWAGSEVCEEQEPFDNIEVSLKMN